MSLGDDCEYLRTAIKEKIIGVAKALGGADVHIKFFHGDEQQVQYAVVHTQLPWLAYHASLKG
jgi:hypothetical protein